MYSVRRPPAACRSHRRWPLDRIKSTRDVAPVDGLYPITCTVVPFDKPPVNKLDPQLSMGICVNCDGGTGVKLKITFMLIA